MNADHFFSIGKTHTVCQDYALTGLDPFPYAIVSDGCSSSPHTDVGARILAWAAQRNIENLDKEIIIREAWEAARSLGLPQECLDATLLVATFKDNSFHVKIAGDGLVACQLTNGNVVQNSFEHGSYPFYLSYYLSPTRLTAWKNHSSIRDGFRTQNYNAEDIKILALFSDGIESFQQLDVTSSSKRMVDVPVDDILRQVLVMPNHKGRFVYRNCHWFEKKFCSKNQWFHSDDFSMAAIKNES